MIEILVEFHLELFLDRYLKKLKDVIASEAYNYIYVYTDDIIPKEEFINITNYYFYFKTSENKIVKTMPASIEKEVSIDEGERCLVSFVVIDKYSVDLFKRKDLFKIIEEKGFHVVKRINECK